MRVGVTLYQNVRWTIAEAAGCVCCSGMSTYEATNAVLEAIAVWLAEQGESNAGLLLAGLSDDDSEAQ